MNYFKQDKPFIVPTTDGKLIEEHFGLATNQNSDLSIAHMVAPPGWSEPHQKPEFDEYTLVSRGKKMFEVDGEEIIVTAGQSILIKKGSRVRYSNPFEESCEYWSVCLPAFSMELVNREEISL
jgi:mannose-6-phosphate isomerase-like protein (cupin superfamily)